MISNQLLERKHSTKNLKVLIANKFYHLKGGSERVMFNEKALLEQHGHELFSFAMTHESNEHSETERFFVPQVNYNKKTGLFRRVQQSGKIIYNFESRRKIEALVREFKPDIAHLHNIYHQLSPSIISALSKTSIPTVMTLHDYKLVCPSYNLFTNGNICEACAGSSFYHCLVKRCTKNSFSGSAINCLEMYLHKLIHIYERGVNVFISPSVFLINKVSQMGFKAQHIVHIPNFIDAREYEVSFNFTNKIVYFGRLSIEKGVKTLLKAATKLPQHTFHIIGDGLERDSLLLSRSQNVRFLGHLSKADMSREIADAMVVVVPSELYENCPMSILEAYAMGKPVIASRIGGIPEIVEDRVDGLLFAPGDHEELADLINTLARKQRMARDMGMAAREKVERVYSPELHYEKLLSAYKLAQDSPDPRRHSTSNKKRDSA